MKNKEPIFYVSTNIGGVTRVFWAYQSNGDKNTFIVKVSQELANDNSLGVSSFKKDDFNNIKTFNDKSDMPSTPGVSVKQLL